MHCDELGCEISFDSVSGFTLESCAVLGHRREPEEVVDPARMESWVLQPVPTAPITGKRATRLELGLDGYLTALWFSPAGSLYATDLRGRLFASTSEDSGRSGWTVVDFGTEIELCGVWGIDDRDIYVWGRDAWTPLLWRLHSTGFESMPAPPGNVTLLRGLGPELLYAAGDGGLLAFWNGSDWRRIPLPTVRNATGLWMGDPDDVWMTTDSGKLFEGTRYGWALRSKFDGPLYDVARWRGALWLAAGPRGLHRLVDRSDRFEPADLGIPATALEARGDLLALAPGYLAASSDGAVFDVACEDALRIARGTEQPSWRAMVDPSSPPR